MRESHKNCSQIVRLIKPKQNGFRESSNTRTRERAKQKAEETDDRSRNGICFLSLSLLFLVFACRSVHHAPFFSLSFSLKLSVRARSLTKCDFHRKAQYSASDRASEKIDSHCQNIATLRTFWQRYVTSCLSLAIVLTKNRVPGRCGRKYWISQSAELVFFCPETISIILLRHV